MLKVTLQSDFTDFYDHWFDTTGTPFQRMSQSMDRVEQFGTLIRMGLQPPRFGTPAKMIVANSHYATYQQTTLVVVYTDLKAHRGEGKELMTLSAALVKHAQTPCSLYIEPLGDIPLSVRYLRIGESVKWLSFTSTDSWRSNCGAEVTVAWTEPITGLRTFRDNLQLPILAVDFVQSRGGLWAAIDLNTAPGLSGTPVEEELSALDVAEMIKEWYSRSTPAAEYGKTIGERIKGRRISLSMSQEQLAEKTSISPSMVSYLENGMRQGTLSLLVGLVEALEWSLDELVAGASLGGI